MRAAALICLAMLLPAGAARAQYVYHGNDTGGIISWSCENEAYAREIAGAYCARWDKYARITSVHRRYGDFISFNCLWSPYAAPYGLPEVRVRSACYEPRLTPRVRALD
jgi:hypothetical protein